MTLLKSLFFASLFFSGITCFSQQNAVPDFAGQLRAYNQAMVPEKIFVHTDKATYLAGELLWFKVYCVDAQHKLQSMSTVAYVDVLDADHKFLTQAKLALQNGTGSGSVFLPLSATSGRYLLRSYTNWMKNFGPDQFFEKPVTIINSLKPLEKTRADSGRVMVRFFPEGGNLVSGLESTLGVEVVTSGGSDVAYTGVVVSENGDTVAHLQSQKFGMGRFVFRPQVGHSYKAIIAIAGGRTFQQSLPQAMDNGYVMHAEKKNGALNITVTTSAVRDRDLYLVVQNGAAVQSAQVKPLSNNTAAFDIDTALLLPGISYVTVFNEVRTPVCERIFFKRPYAVQDVTVTATNTDYEPRRQVTLNLNRTDSAALSLSLSVYRNDSLQSADAETIESSFWLASALHNSIDNPGYYFSNDADVADATENLLLTHGWRRFNWDAVVKNESANIRFAPEVNGQLLRVAVTDKQTGAAASGIYTYLSIPGNPFQFYAAKSDNSGIAVFDVKNQFGPSEVILQTNSLYDSSYRLELLPAAAQQFSDAWLPRYTFSKPHAQTLLQNSVAMQVQQIYTKDSLGKFQIPTAYDTVPFFGRADYTYLLDLYTRFSTMEEVLREYVRPINVVRRGGGLHMLLFDDARRQFFDGGELVLLDGIPLFHKDAIFAYDPLKVKRLDIISRKYFFGPGLFNGVASFTTYNGNYEGLQLDPHSIIIDYEGLQLQREFYEPVYETDAQRKSRLPDYRTTLYWNGDIKLDGQSSSVSFYTSDVKGNYTVELQGLDATGRTVVTRLPLTVK